MITRHFNNLKSFPDLRYNTGTKTGYVRKTYANVLHFDSPEFSEIQRVGFLIYTYAKGEKYIGLAIDTKYKQATDWGGGRHLSLPILSEGARELYEESLGLFDYRDPKDLDRICNDQSTICINDKYTMNFLIYADIDINQSKIDFRNRYNLAMSDPNRDKMPENCAIEWLSEYQFMDMINRTPSPAQFGISNQTFIGMPIMFESRTEYNYVYDPNNLEVLTMYDRIRNLIRSSGKKLFYIHYKNIPRDYF